MDLPFRLGRFELTRQLGAGGMGVVYYGTAAGTPVAVKVIRADLAGDAEFRARFRREITLMRRVVGTCTARVVDADPDADPPYLAVEYLPGPTLAARIQAQGPMEPEIVRTLAVGLAEALIAIHTAGVVHRDLKPGNVLLTASGPKVVDFGIATAADMTSLTRTGAAIGSPAYMSPEQIAGVAVGPPTDVFAWACTVAFAATGRPPFGHGPTDAVLFRIRHDPPDLANVPVELRDLLSAALAKDPQHRPDARGLLRQMLVLSGNHAEATATDSDLFAAVTRVISDGWPSRTDPPPLLPLPATATSAPRKRRPRRMAAGSIAAAMLAVAALAIFFGQPWQTTGSFVPAAAGTVTESPATTTRIITSSPSTSPVTRTADAASAAATSVVTWTPFNDAGGMAPGLTINHTTTGTCITPAKASARPDSLRCFGDDNSIYDPCWRHDSWATQPDLLLCGFPGESQLTRIQPTSPLPVSDTATPVDPSATDPASIVLADGQHCIFLEGAGAPEVNGERANYACPHGIAFGIPDRTSPTWRILYRLEANTELTQVPITLAYF
ncbi:serine/threonine-protein kinase [Frankia gtarii]|uniref:serine/threonine-protein kinase n=1 Tax=Frankia gtarii TaxID=2950102 RepID=UPI0021C01F5B|nr:serine/threonine-protein kinase [Frankia gtarii]